MPVQIPVCKVEHVMIEVHGKPFWLLIVYNYFTKSEFYEVR